MSGKKSKKIFTPPKENSLRVQIKFQNQALTNLRKKLLADGSREYYACLLGQKNIIDDLCIITVKDVYFPDSEYYENQSVTSLRVSGDFLRERLLEIEERIDVDTMIDVHTHPFSNSNVWFSGTDDKDEINFVNYLAEEGAEISYASIVFSQTDYQARYWFLENGRAVKIPALIKTQKVTESIPSSDLKFDAEKKIKVDEMFNRSVLALGLDNMRKITGNQKISVVGVGGIGSILAENLIHMGFNFINLIDFDKLEISNLNRIVAATYEDAVKERVKVEAIKNNLLKINPRATINALNHNVFDFEVEKVLADSDWILVATDNHASRFHIQELAFKYFVPFITVGVNITVEDGEIKDMSGEVILVRIGDRVCLTCLKRLKPNEIAKEIHPDKNVRAGLVQKGYVRGADVKEPAVKTLNSIIANLATDTLINQYTERQRDVVIQVYENNFAPAIYEDVDSVKHRNLNCGTCDI
ncbi:MAG: ThiF family adenylyltransferase [Selenomonadaceae bacterium]|nr:ThiF family adenylyltransferase [Selenomonadaceae bacterium]